MITVWSLGAQFMRWSEGRAGAVARAAGRGAEYCMRKAAEANLRWINQTRVRRG